MDTKRILCKVPLIIISILAVICNTAIIIFQRRKKIINGRIRYFLYSLIAIDLIYSSFILSMVVLIFLTQITTTKDIPRPGSINATVRSLAFSFTHIQLFTQTAIAVERFTAVKFPILYRNSLSKVNCKIIILGIWIASLSLGTAVTFPSILYDLPRVIMFTCAITYTLSMILIATMYALITLQIRKHTRTVDMRNQDNFREDQSDRRERARDKERKTLLFSVAIVATYFILNTTLVVYAFFFDEGTESVPILARSCDTQNGLLANIAFGIAVFNRAMNPLLYWCLWYHIKKERVEPSDAGRLQIQLSLATKQ